MIKADELEDLDTEESFVLENKKYAESITSSRDNVKVRKKVAKYGVELVILGMEGQEHIHYAMPMRVMGYDYSTYKKQYNDNATLGLHKGQKTIALKYISGKKNIIEKY